MIVILFVIAISELILVINLYSLQERKQLIEMDNVFHKSTKNDCSESQTTIHSKETTTPYTPYQISLKHPSEYPKICRFVNEGKSTVVVNITQTSFQFSYTI